MPLPGESEGKRTAQGLSPLVVLVLGQELRRDVVAPLESQGYRVSPVETPEEAARIVRETRPSVLILADGDAASSGGAWAETRNIARGLGIPVLDILDDQGSAEDLLSRSEDADDWVTRNGLGTELPVRVARLIRRSSNGHEGVSRGIAPLDSHFIALMVHDLRTPLNVIGLSLRMIDQAIPRGDPDLEEDLRFVEENFKQIERMLAQLSDYYRLYEPELRLSDTEFSPKRLLDELLETRSFKAGSKAGPTRADVQESCPEAVALDPIRARTAIEYALANAISAAGGEPVRVLLRGEEPGRLVVEIRLDQPPPGSVQSQVLSPQRFERLCGSAAERRGMELAIAARVSEMFGGSARLEAEEGKGTAIILDWPTRLSLN